jgi:hypothetical protein
VRVLESCGVVSLVQRDLHVHRDPAPASNAEEAAGWSEPAALRGGAFIGETEELLGRARIFEGKDEPCGPAIFHHMDGSRSGKHHLALPLHGGQKEANRFSVACAMVQHVAS